MDIKSIGNKIRYARKNEGMTITELAKRSGLSISYISDVERGRKHPSFKAVSFIMEVLGYDIYFAKVEKTKIII